MHIYCELDQHDRDEARKLLDRLVELCEQDGVAIVQAAYLWNCEVLQSRRPSIRLTTSIGLSDDELIYAANVIKRNSVLVCREIDFNSNKIQRPSSLPLDTHTRLSEASTPQLLSSPVLEHRPLILGGGGRGRLRTYSGS